MKREELITLLRICESIQETYEEMALLEKQNKRDTEEFRKLVERLKTTRNIEKNIIEKISLTSQTVKDIVKERSNIYNEAQNISDTIVLNNQETENNLAVARIVQRLKSEISLDAKQTLMEVMQSIIPKELLESGELIIDEKAYKDYSGQAETRLSIRRDISILIYKFLEKEILSYSNIEIKNALIDYKYSLIMLDSNIEELLMGSMYQPLENLHIESEIIAAILQVSPDEYTKHKNDIALRTLNREIGISMETYDYEIDYPKIKSAIIFRNAIIKSCLELLSPEKVKEYQEKFIEKINSKQYLELHYSPRVRNLISLDFEIIGQQLEGVSRLTLKG